MDFSNFVGKKVEYVGVYGVVKDFYENVRSIKVRFDNKKTQGFCIDDYIFEIDNNGMLHVKEKDESTASGTKSAANYQSAPSEGEKGQKTDTKGFNVTDSAGIMTPKSDLDYWPAPSEDTRIYHSTSFQNMISIIKKNGIFSRWQLLQMGLIFQDTANSHIIHWRKKLGIENMIPFHFKSKTPYEYAVFTDNGAGQKHKTIPIEDMVVITIDKHKYDYCSYIFTAHPLSNNAEKFRTNDPIVPKLKFWRILDHYKGLNPKGKDPASNEKKQICMSEYDVGLSYIPLDDILEIYVQTQEKADILLAADKRGILKDKIKVGKKRYLF